MCDQEKIRPRHHLLQNVVIRLLHDSSLLARLYDQPHAVAVELKLTAEEVGWLVAMDQRRWEIDSELPHRSLEGALSHCPVTGLVISSLCRQAQSLSTDLKSGVEELLSYYQSAAFHQCIDQGAYLAESMMLWILQTITPRTPAALYRSQQISEALITLEYTLAVARRAQYMLIDDQPDMSLQDMDLSSVNLSLPLTSQIYTTSEGVVEVYLALYEEALRLTQAHGRARLLKAQIDLEALPIKTGTSVTALIQRGIDGVSVETLSSGLAKALNIARAGGSLTTLRQLLIDAEVESEDALEMIQGWVTEGLITLTL